MNGEGVTMQAVLVGLLVAVSAVYAAWTLMPARARRALARRLLAAWPVLGRVSGLGGALQRANRGGGACGCDDCPSGAAPTPGATVAPIRLHRPPRRDARTPH